MISVQEQPEPPSFNGKVRNPGNDFLLNCPKPTTDQFAANAYWRKIIPDLYESYSGICAYCSEWMSLGVGGLTIDHYLPKEKTLFPELAYEWSNYRLASSRFNARKSNSLDVIDPFRMGDNWFHLDFSRNKINPNPNLPLYIFTHVQATISRLKLNDKLTKISREKWIRDYCKHNLPIDFMKKRAPFIASELERQNLIVTIKKMIKYKK